MSIGDYIGKDCLYERTCMMYSLRRTCRAIQMYRDDNPERPSVCVSKNRSVISKVKKCESV